MSAKQRRQGKRMCVKRKSDKITDILEAKDAIDLAQLQLSLKKLHSYKADLEGADAVVLDEIADITEAEKEINDTALYNDELLEIISRAEIKIDEVSTRQQTAGTEAVSADRTTSSSSKATLRLPKLELKPFSGEPLEWQSFWDSFDNSVHSNQHLSAIDKLNYLKGLLTGDALKAVEGYRLTSANYDAVIDTLTERFGDKQLAIFAHFEAMLALPQASHDVGQLQSISDKCEQHIRSLVALGLDESTFSQVFTPIMLSKLPKFVKIELHRRNGSKTWSLAHLREWLKDEIRARDMSERSFGDGRQSTKETTSSSKTLASARQELPSRRQFVAQKSATTSSALVSTTPQQKATCTFCGDAHYSDLCTKFPDTPSRKAQAKNRCFVCLAKGHQSKACKRSIPCVHCKKKGHHRSLCYAKFGGPIRNNVSNENELNIEAHTERSGSSDAGCGKTGKRTILQTAVANIVNSESGIGANARLLFDTAGSKTFITEQKRQELQLPFKGEEYISIAGFQSKKRRTAKYKTVEFSVQCSNGSSQVVSASVVPSITCPIQKIPISVDKYPAFKTLPLAEPLVLEPEFVPIDVLIGLDYYYEFVNGERIQCPNGPLLLSSKLGYIATGRINTEDTGPETIAVMFLNANSPESLSNHNFDVERFWELEDIGMKERSKQLSGDDEALKYHSETLDRDDDGRFVSRWPWKCKQPELADNFDVAYGRLTSLLRRITTTPDVLAAYSKVIEDQLKVGVIEEAPEQPTGPSVYYVPHHCVVTPSKSTTKLRVVYDASSKASREKLSLNDCLHRGPVLLEDLAGLLMRFRLQRVALVSDIEKAFLQIGLHTEERDVTRFLWVKDTSLPVSGDNLVVYRFTRIPFGVISSPFVLENTMCQHLRRSKSPVALKILRDHYVDNVITGEDGVTPAMRHYDEAKALFRNARMNLREWYTNSTEVRDAFAEADRGSECVPKILGLRWDYTNDTLSSEFPHSSQNDCSVVTKRSVLRAVAQLFDPLGFLSPVTVRGKILVQDVWKAGFGWDEKLPVQYIERWLKVLQNLKNVGSLSIPRFVGGDDSNPIELHVFCDASARACAAVIYLRKRSPQIQCDIILAKTRLAPAKTAQTIPRLELIAVVLGTRLLKFVNDQLHCRIDRKVVWTDSQCTLHWIRREQISARFVENRVQELRKHDDVNFRYVPSEDNPAVLSSRGCDVERLRNSVLWWNGPAWLSETEQSWPEFQVSLAVAAQENLVISQNDVQRTQLVDETRFSTFSRLLRCTAFVLRFIHNVRNLKSDRFVGPLSAEELGSAQQHIIRAHQAQNFPELAKSQNNFSAGSVRQLGVFKDTFGLLRCSGRLAAADLAYDAKYPMLLPKGSHLTDLIICACHIKLHHAGTAETLAHIRQKFWIIQGRNSVRRVIRKCFRCRRAAGGPYKIPLPPNLPASRVLEEPAFSNVGLDYIGPLLVKSPDKSVRKVWVVLYACMVVRAVHLEVVDDLSTDQFLMSLRRFIASHGVPCHIVSDNASQLRLATVVIDKLWRELLESPHVQDFAANIGIKWEFIVEFAPWMGGFYERLVGVVKHSLKRTLQGVLATHAELQTVLSEIAAVVNSRPLVYVENDVGSEVLTPSHFLSKGVKPGLPSFPDAVDEYKPRLSRADDLVTKWKRLKAIGDRFWKMWKHRYLLSLRERQDMQRQRNSCDIDPRVGDVVLLQDPAPRAQWRIAKIVQLNCSKDRQVRSAVVRLSSGKHMRRPIKLLHPLEIGEFPPSASANSVELEMGEFPPNVSVSRVMASSETRALPPRQAAATARKRWRQYIADGSQ